jgi:rhodanese-related sulfurtransferase
MGAGPFRENRLPIEGVYSPLAAETQELDVTIVDLRSPAVFASGFIPGSFHFPDIDCLELLRANNLLAGQRMYGVADEPEQIARCAEIVASGVELEFGSWSSPKTIEWRKRRGVLGSIELLEADTLAVRVWAWKTVVVDTRGRAAFAQARIPESLCIPLDSLTGAFAGLPPETALCAVCDTGTRASFAASLIWRLGFRNVSFLRGGFAVYRERRLPLAKSGS